MESAGPGDELNVAIFKLSCSAVELFSMNPKRNLLPRTTTDLAQTVVIMWLLLWLGYVSKADSGNTTGDGCFKSVT